MKKHQKKVFNHDTGKFNPPATQKPAGEWWRDAVGIGNEPGEGVAARERKKVQDEIIKEQTE